MEDETLGNSLQEVLNGRAMPKFPREMVASHEVDIGSRFLSENDYYDMGYCSLLSEVEPIGGNYYL